MKNIKILFALIFSLCSLWLIGCSSPMPLSNLNSLQIQAMQTQEFNAPKRKIFNAVMTVMQNNGYTIHEANFDTGFITAKSVTKDSPFTNLINGSIDKSAQNNQLADGLKFFVMGPSRIDHHNYTLIVTAFTILKEKNITKVRLSFVQSNTSVGMTTETKDSQVTDPKFYKEFFAKIRQEVFVADDL